MPAGGLEPSLPLGKRILNPPRLPFRHAGTCVSTGTGAARTQLMSKRIDFRLPQASPHSLSRHRCWGRGSSFARPGVRNYQQKSPHHQPLGTCSLNQPGKPTPWANISPEACGSSIPSNPSNIPVASAESNRPAFPTLLKVPVASTFSGGACHYYSIALNRIAHRIRKPSIASELGERQPPRPQGNQPVSLD